MFPSPFKYVFDIKQISSIAIKNTRNIIAAQPTIAYGMLCGAQFLTSIGAPREILFLT